MKFLRTLIIVSLLAAGFAFIPALPNASAADDCLNASGNGDSDLYFGPFAVSAGTSITITMTTNEGSGTWMGIWANGSYVFESTQYTATHTHTYTFTSEDDEVYVDLDWQHNGQAANSYTVTSSNCGTTLPNIPEQAVSGTFLTTAEIYWAPGELVNPMTYIEAGKSYWVAGQDETGMYRKVLIACTWVWVRAETVGPNFDEVWNGTPLPTTVVEAGDTNACSVNSGTSIAPHITEEEEEIINEVPTDLQN